MLPYHVYIQFSNSRKKFSKFIFYAYFLKEYFKEPVEKLFSAQWRDFFQKIKITIYVAQNLILTNETPLKSMILNKFSFGSFRFGGRNAKIIKKPRSYWFSLRPLRIASKKIEPPKKAGALFISYPIKTRIFLNIALGLKTTMESCSPTPIYPAFLVLDFW